MKVIASWAAWSAGGGIGGFRQLKAADGARAGREIGVIIFRVVDVEKRRAGGLGGGGAGPAFRMIKKIIHHASAGSEGADELLDFGLVEDLEPAVILRATEGDADVEGAAGFQNAFEFGDRPQVVAQLRFLFGGVGGVEQRV